MTSSPFVDQPPEPLRRLQVDDGLRINAERWKIAHDYHRHRQNLHFQALWEPGIVYGLGVKLLKSAPPTAPERFRDSSDRRWVEIQPGLAIDRAGNPIVVSADPQRSLTYRLATPDLTQSKDSRKNSLTVHLVIGYQDPDELEKPVAESAQAKDAQVTVTEGFYLSERRGQLEPQDVELCRVRLEPGSVELESPGDVFSPQVNELDLRYRPQAHLRSQRTIQIEVLAPPHSPTAQGCRALVESLPSLYPNLQAQLGEGINRGDLSKLVPPASPDLVYTRIDILRQWLKDGDPKQGQKTLKRLIESGSTLLVDGVQKPQHANEWVKWLTGHQDGSVLKDAPPLLLQSPFRFGLLPQSMRLRVGVGLVMVMGNLAAAWEGTNLPRTEIRAAHELGINILNFVEKRRRLFDLMR